jgi:hypothetical protein
MYDGSVETEAGPYPFTEMDMSILTLLASHTHTALSRAQSAADMVRSRCSCRSHTSTINTSVSPCCLHLSVSHTRTGPLRAFTLTCFWFFLFCCCVPLMGPRRQKRAERKAQSLLELVRFDSDGMKLPMLVSHIVASAYSLIGAERISLYLVDFVKNELWVAVSKVRSTSGGRAACLSAR